MGGTNNVSNKCNSSYSSNTLLSTVQEKVVLYSHTNLIIATIPYRYDLHENSVENKQISDINNGIRSLINKYPHLDLLDLWLFPNRYHTQHGLHINRRGKKFIAAEVRKIIEGNSALKRRSLKLDTASFNRPINLSDGIFDKNHPFIIVKKENMR